MKGGVIFDEKKIVPRSKDKCIQDKTRQDKTILFPTNKAFKPTRTYNINNGKDEQYTYNQPLYRNTFLMWNEYLQQ